MRAIRRHAKWFAVVLLILLNTSGCIQQPTVPSQRRQMHGNTAPYRMARRCTAPVDAPIVEGFHPPPKPWLAGNRGLTFGTHRGQQVRAVEQGTVSYAGFIAGEGYVTVRFAGGRDSTYAYLSSFVVTRGQFILAGSIVGQTGFTRFQLGYREGDRYLDPTPLLAAHCNGKHAVLVPVGDR